MWFVLDQQVRGSGLVRHGRLQRPSECGNQANLHMSRIEDRRHSVFHVNQWELSRRTT